MSAINLPHPSEVWAQSLLRDSRPAAERFVKSDLLKIRWSVPFDPMNFMEEAPQIAAYDYIFRLNWNESTCEWWIEGAGGQEPAFVQIEGPIDLPSPIETALTNLANALYEALIKEAMGAGASSPHGRD